jgi:hypothetical protein
VLIAICDFLTEIGQHGAHSLSAALTFNLPESNVCIASIAYIQRYRSSGSGRWQAILRRRARIIAKLEEKAVAADPNYQWTVRRRVVENGEKKLVEVTQKGQAWWRPAGNEMYALGIRLGL